MSLHPESPNDLSWLRALETLENNNGELLLTEERDEDSECPPALRRLVDNYVQHASSNTLQELFDIWDVAISKTPRDLKAVWSGARSLGERFERILEESREITSTKCEFIYKQVILGVLKKGRWSQDDVMSHIVNSLLRLQEYYDWFPQNDSTSLHAHQRFEAKRFLMNIASTVWYGLTSRDSLNIFVGRSNDGIKLSRAQSEKLVPVLRQLAMRDLIDPEWNLVGDWSAVLTHLEQRGVYVSRFPADKTLAKWSEGLKLARNSVRCQQLGSSRIGTFGAMFEAQQRWTYFPKCSATFCSNMETPDDPHSLRCERCYYYHYCSSACKGYCEELTQVHAMHCGNSPPDQVAVTKRQMRVFLQLDEAETDLCNACGKKSGDLQLCSRCKKVKYCSRFCQQWDWEENGHKQGRKKKASD